MADDEKNPPKVELEIVRHRQLFQLLREPKSIWRLMLTALSLVVVLFFGLSLVVLSIKKIYPYNSIETNLHGATTMGNEDAEVTYWLFNTSELWGNSGIEVEKGDKLTIRSSGRWHTAIHHLVDDARYNHMMRDPWTGSEGMRRTGSIEDFRSQFRLHPGSTDGILLMTILDYRNQKKSSNLQSAKNADFCRVLDTMSVNVESPRIYEIGTERRDFKVSESGFLHFAVNDIMLTRANIRRIYRKMIDDMVADSIDITPAQVATLRSWVDSWGDDGTIDITPVAQLDTLLAAKVQDKGYIHGPRPDLKDGHKHLLNNEMIYYYQNNFIDPWYVDNLGSLLIIIERTKAK